MMSELVKAGKKNPTVRAKATNLVQSLTPKDWFAEIHTLFNFVQNTIRYVRDIRGVETLHYPEQILAQEYGDCDDKAILLAALLEAIGHPTRFVAVGFRPYQYSHVFTDTRIRNNKWLSLDPTEMRPMGWRPPGIVSIISWYN
jgi:transglutaminase-like putative cysteine protease